MPPPEEQWYRPDTEIVFGLSSAVGTDVDAIEKILDERLDNHFGYKLNVIRVSRILQRMDELDTRVDDSSPYRRLSTLMDAGDEARSRGANDILSRLAVCEIARCRDDGQPLGRTAHLIRSLKHPQEVQLLRSVYGSGFFLLGIFGTEEKRQQVLTDDKGLSIPESRELLDRDAGEGTEFGQRTRDTYHLSDVFVDFSNPDECKRQIWRFLDLLFGRPCLTPTLDEHAMYSAFAASVRSADLSRQVGAAIFNEHGECVASGCNDVPRSGGGLYWPGDGDQRDWARGHDPNAKQREEIAEDLVERLRGHAASKGEEFGEDLIRGLIRGSKIADVTEYGRAVHAEMEALLSASRVGIPVRGGTLYGTTFPCHNCAKHIVAAGVRRVVYIEPYPKSRAMDLHADSVEHAPPGCALEEGGKVHFEPYIGVGPRRYFDLFSVRHGSGLIRSRERNGKVLAWVSEQSHTRIPMWPSTYIDRESIAIQKLSGIFEEGESQKAESQLKDDA